ncbi:MAG: squalene/phytoene synthase family protein [Alphaproteobacteria bacterium]|jgi:phytoene synthase|nr:squalene/phytoene synthase family protein [Alphaproteobacteria bacterium]
MVEMRREAEDRAVLARQGRSFHWGVRLLPRETARDAAALYAFCRHVDDVADAAEAAPGGVPVARARLAVLQAGIAAGLPVTGPVGRFLDLAARHDMSRKPALDLIQGAMADLEGLRLDTVDELVVYGYRMAGTVGEMMVPLLGARPAAAAAPFAVDLGIAMQLTNIGRDVVEDAAMGRRYLPAELLGGDPEPALLADPPLGLATRVWDAVLAILALARTYYRSADQGMVYLPPRTRLAVLAAARIYEGIGRQIVRAGPEAYWSRRAVVPARGKAWRTLRAVGALVRSVGARPVAHDDTLHRPLRALAPAPPGRRAA